MINKNISVWRGTQTPPTNYHLWEKEDGSIYVYVDEKWQHLIAPNDKTILDEHLQQLNKIKDLAITEVTPTNTNTYKSYLLKSGDNIFGTTIDIPKDKFIKLVTLGYDNATIDTSTGNINIGTGLAKEYLLFSITLDTGNYELISINLSEFITEKDYSDGLEVVDNKLKVKVDPNSEEYLKVTNNGIKVEGINTKVSGTVDDIKNKILNGEWLPLKQGRKSDGTLVPDSVAMGYNSEATGQYSTAFGYECKATGESSYAEGYSTTASGNYSHAEGIYNYAANNFLHMIGIGNEEYRKNACVIYVKRGSGGIPDLSDKKTGYMYLLGVGDYDGQNITDDIKSVQEVLAEHNRIIDLPIWKGTGLKAIREGSDCIASGDYSHAEGKYCTASGYSSHAQGIYNYDDSSFIDMVGVGNSSSSKKNASAIYVGRDSNNGINTSDPKNGYQYLIDVGGYQGQGIGDAKSVQEVFTDLENNKVDKTDITTITNDEIDEMFE